MKAEVVIDSRNVVVTSFDDTFRFRRPIPFEHLSEAVLQINSNPLSTRTISAKLVNNTKDIDFKI